MLKGFTLLMSSTLCSSMSIVIKDPVRPTPALREEGEEGRREGERGEGGI